MSSNRAAPRGVRAPAAAALLAATATIVFLIPWWNRHLGLSLDGYLPLYGWKILAGEVPYRDFYLHLPPLQPLLEAALQALTGRSLIAVRIVGALGRIALAAITAAWLARRFQPGTAALASFAAVCIASSDDTEILDLYNHHALVGAIASGWLASIALDRGRGERWAWFGSGAAGAAAFWVKQTVGLGAAVVVPLAISILLLRDRENRPALLRGGAGFALGWAAFSLPLVGWLWRTDALRPFIDQVFLGAAASKAVAGELFLRPWFDPFGLPGVTRSAVLGLTLAVLVWIVSRAALQRLDGERLRPGRLLGYAGGLSVAIATLFLVVLRLRLEDPMQLSLDLLATLRVGLFAGVFGTLFVAIHLVWIALRGPLDPGEAELLLLCGAGQAAAAMHALSFPAGGTGALPCVAVVLALALDAPARGRLRAPLRLLAVATLLIATLAAASLRALLPFHFVEWRQPPIVKATERSALPELAGLRLSADTVRLVDDVTRLVVAATRSGEPLFTYPVFPIFNWLADRPVPTFAILHWIDVTPDPVVDADLARLLAAPPPVVVFQWVRDRLLRLNERYFRDGRQSAMARMQMALAALLADGYVLAYDGEIPYYYSAPPLQVWIRRDRAEAAGIEPLEREEEERDPGRE